MTAASLALELNLFCIAELAFILYRVLRRNDRQLSQLKFRDMVLWHIIALTVNAVSPFAVSRISDPRSLAIARFLLYMIYYILLNMAIRSWCIFFVYSAELDKKSQKAFLTYENVSTAVIIFMNATSQFTHIFYYMEDGKMGVTPYMQVQITYLFGSQFAIAARVIFSTRKHMSRLMRQKICLIATYPIIPFLFMALRAVTGNLPYLAISNTMAILIMYVGYLDNLVSVDPLTGINNRDHMAEHIQRKMDENPDHLCLLMFDINHFKRINDTYGHVEGDNALKLISEALCNCFRGPYRSSFLGRYGGDEFIVVLEATEEESDELLENIRQEVAHLHDERALPYSLTLSAGRAWYSREMKTPEEFVAVADKDLYLDKARMHREGK